MLSESNGAEEKIHIHDLTSVTHRVFSLYKDTASFESAALGRRLGVSLSALGAEDILREVRRTK
jgi:hypothetical protein